MLDISDGPAVGANAFKAKAILNAAKGLADAIRAVGGALGNLGEKIIDQLEELLAKEGKPLTGGTVNTVDTEVSKKETD